MGEQLPVDLRQRLKDFPVIGAPLFIISNPDLVLAQCKNGVVGSFPALNARPEATLDEWLARITEELAAYNESNPGKPAAPFAVNQICHPSNNRLGHDVEMCVKYRVPVVITSLNPPKEVVQAVHSYGGIIMHDIISIRHAQKALEQGVDGLICVAAGAGGHAGMLSPFALIREIRSFFDGPVALSGAISYGDAVLAAAIAVEETAERSADGVSPADNLRRSIGHVARRQVGRARRAMGEVATWTGDPLLARDFAEDQLDQIRAVLDQLDGDDESRPGSPLWTDRSRRRHLETITLSIADLKAAGKALDASINDLFVTGLAMGAIDYHRAHGVTPEGLNASFVVSTRSDDAIGGNSFTPTMLPLAGSYRKPKPYLKDVKKRMAARREAVAGDGALAGFAGVANLLPTSVVTQVARATAGKLDIATSNLRGAPFPTFISGAQVERNITLGPVSGTAMNITAMSNADVFEIGLVIDPAAVADPAELRDHVAAAYTDLLAAADS